MKLLNQTLAKIPVIPRKYLYYISSIVVVAALYHLIYAHKIIPGVKVGSVKVGGMTYDQAKKELEKYENQVNKNLTFVYEKNKYNINAKDINLQYNWDASISRAFEVGRTGNFLVDTKDKVAGILKPIYLAAFYDYDEDLFHIKFAQIKGEINKGGNDAKFILAAPGQIDTLDATEGRAVSSNDFFNMIISSLDRVSFEEKILPVDKIVPKITKTDIEPYRDQVKKIVLNGLKIKNESKTWELTPAQMIGFLTFTKNGTTVDMTINSPVFQDYVAALALEVNKPPRGKVTQVDGNKVISFAITQNGKEMDTRKFAKAFKEAYFGIQPTVELTLKDIEGPSDKEHYGIFSLLGEGKSKFAGSSNARIHNLTLAAERTNGVLVPPGGIYSLNNSVGEISGRTGYNAALIIQNGRTVLGEGGGVCQTSTTLFRAVLNAGLPVVMRYPHAYRVHYYEEDSPLGFDASIFQPTLDFQFKNDTPNYVLVQTEADVANVALSFKIYGTPDGRSVDITQPIITSQTPPPPPLEIEDPNLPKGTRIQNEWAAWGANTSFTRTVKRAGQIIHTETFASRYQPWKAVYTVGTKK